MRASPALVLPALLLASCLTLTEDDLLLPNAGPSVPTESSITRKDPESGKVVRYEDRLDLPDGSSIKHGVERTWYPSGARRAERRFERGEPVGVWRSWYEDGTPRSEASFVAEEQPAAMSFWHPNGTLSARGLARLGVREGEWTYWYADGTVREQGPYAGGERDGEWSFFHEDGSLRSRGIYGNGQRVGVWEHAQPGEVEAAPERDQ